MNLYLDTEFDGHDGALISMALVAGYGGPGRFAKSLHDFLLKLPKGEEHVIIADWPEDIAHFCRCLCAEHGWQLNYWPTMVLLESGKLDPVVPHNALEDARALRRWAERLAA